MMSSHSTRTGRRSSLTTPQPIGYSHSAGSNLTIPSTPKSPPSTGRVLGMRSSISRRSSISGGKRGSQRATSPMDAGEEEEKPPVSPSVLARIESLERERDELQKRVDECEPLVLEGHQAKAELAASQGECHMLQGALQQEERAREASMELQKRTQSQYEEQRHRADSFESMYQETSERLKSAVGKHSEVVQALQVEMAGKDKAEQEVVRLRDELRGLRARSEEMAMQLATETSSRKALQDRVKDKDEAIRVMREDIRDIQAQARSSDEKREVSEQGAAERTHVLKNRARSAEEQVAVLRLKLGKEEEGKSEAERRSREYKASCADTDERLRGAMAQLSASKEYACRLEDEVAKKQERIQNAAESERRWGQRLAQAEEGAKAEQRESKGRESALVSEVSGLKEELRRTETDRARLEERLSHKEARGGEAEARCAALEGQVAALSEGKAAADGAVEGLRGVERGLREEVEGLSRRVGEEKAAGLRCLTENRALLVEVRNVEERSVELLKMLQAEEDRGSRLGYVAEELDRECKELRSSVAIKTREAADSARALGEAQQELARLGAKTQSDAAEGQRAKGEIESLTVRLAAAQSQSEEFQRRCEAESRGREEARREARQREEQVLSMQRRGALAASELGDARDAEARAMHESSRWEEQLRSLRSAPYSAASSNLQAHASPSPHTSSSRHAALTPVGAGSRPLPPPGGSGYFSGSADPLARMGAVGGFDASRALAELRGGSPMRGDGVGVRASPSALLSGSLGRGLGGMQSLSPPRVGVAPRPA